MEKRERVASPHRERAPNREVTVQQWRPRKRNSTVDSRQRTEENSPLGVREVHPGPGSVLLSTVKAQREEQHCKGNKAPGRSR